jgi:hypothetical protein
MIPNQSFQSENIHRHTEAVSVLKARALAAAANKLSGTKVIILAEANEKTVHPHTDLDTGHRRTTRYQAPEGQVQIGVIAHGDTGPLYDEADRILGTYTQHET